MRQTVVLKSAINDRVVCADRNVPSPGSRGGVCVRANRDNWENPGPWETAEAEINSDGTVSFRSVIQDDPAITALWSGDPELSGSAKYMLCANRPDQPSDQAGPAERWEPVFVAEATRFNGNEIIKSAWALKNVFNGKFLTVDPQDREGRIFANGEAPNENELFYSTVSLSRSTTAGGGVISGGGLSGQVQRDPRGGFMINGVPTLVQGVHDGSGLSQFFYNPEESLRRDRLSAKAGFMCRRSWWDLDGPYWEGRQSQGHWPAGDRAIYPRKYGRERYIDGAVAYLKQGESLGMGAHMARGTWTSTDRHEMAEIVREIIARAGAHTIVVGEGLNEHLAVSPHTPIEHITEFRDRAYEAVALRGNSGLGGYDVEAQNVNGEQLRRYNPGATIIPFHGFRDFEWMNKLERDWNTRYEWRIECGIDGEGIGNGFFISAQRNMHQCNSAFFQIRTALMLACGYITIYMHSPGVVPDEARSESWDSGPGFYDVCKVRTWLPNDAGHFRDVFHGGDGRSFSSRRIYRAIGDTRVEHHLHEDGRFIVVAYGNEAAHIPQNRAHTVDLDQWIEEGHIKGRIIVGQAA